MNDDPAYITDELDDVERAMSIWSGRKMMGQIAAQEILVDAFTRQIDEMSPGDLRPDM